jgi:hypothetical protein
MNTGDERTCPTFIKLTLNNSYLGHFPGTFRVRGNFALIHNRLGNIPNTYDINHYAVEACNVYGCIDVESLKLAA